MPAPGRTTFTTTSPMISAMRAHDLEIEQREAARLADLLHVFHAGDAEHDRAEDDRRDQHLDELDEAIAERLHGRAGLGIEMPERDARGDGDEHLDVKRPPDARGGSQGALTIGEGTRSCKPLVPRLLPASVRTTG